MSPSEKGGVGVCPPPPSVTSRSELLAREAKNNAELARQLAVKRNRRVSEMVSNPGETQEEFDNRVADELRSLRNKSGNEYATTAWQQNLGDSTKYGVVIQTSDSPFISVSAGSMTMEDGGAWERTADRDLHIHGRIAPNSKRLYTDLDEAYLNGKVTANNGPHSGDDAAYIDRRDFSAEDRRNRYGGLVTDRRIIRAENVCGQWIVK